MTKELDAQRAKLHEMFGQLQTYKNKRARKSKAYRDLETQIRIETDKYNAMLVALDLPKE